MKLNPKIKITVKATGSGDGAAALIDGRCQIATMSRFMKDAEFTKAVEKKILPACTRSPWTASASFCTRPTR